MKATGLFVWLFVVCRILVGDSALACTCAGRPVDFFASLRFNNSPGYFQNYYIAKGAVVGLTANGYGTRMKVIHEYYGMGTTDTITIWGSYGADCRASCQVLYHQPPDTFIIAAQRLKGRMAAFEELTDYEVSFCGYFIVQVKGDSVFGGAPGTFTSGGYPLPGFEDSLGGIIQTLDVTTPASEDVPLLVYPNPAGNSVTVQWVQLSPVNNVTVNLSDATGKTVKQYTVEAIYSQGPQKMSLNLDGIANGYYYVTITTGTRKQTAGIRINR